MAHRAHVLRAHADSRGDRPRGLLGVEREHEDAPLPLGQTGEAVAQAAAIEGKEVVLGLPREGTGEAFQHDLAAPPPAPVVPHREPAGSPHEGRDPIRLPHTSRAQPLQGQHQHVLDQVVRGRFVPQVAQAVEPYSRAETAAELTLGKRRIPFPGGHPSSQLSVRGGSEAPAVVHVASVAPLVLSSGKCHGGQGRDTSPLKEEAIKMITNAQSGTRVDEVAPATYRISTPVTILPGGFSFNQYLVMADEPLLFHTGPRRMFPLVREAIAAVMPLERLRFVAFSHVEADECGGLNDLLAAAPRSLPLCGQVAAMVSVNDLADRPPRALADGEVLDLGGKRVRWLDAPHLPHGWECGYLFEETTSTLLCGDLFTQPGAEHEPITEGDILGPSEAMRQGMDYYAHTDGTRGLLEKIAATKPRTLACMHGSAWTGDGQRLLLELADVLSPVAV